jgi:TonB family protein
MEGTVVLVVTITAQGRAKDFVVLRNPGYGLDWTALAAVEHWRFTPARGPDGKPVAVRCIIEVNFRLI